MAAAREQGQRVLAEVTRAAVGRLLADGGHEAVLKADSLFTDEEKQRLADQLAATNATSELLGRARIRLRDEQAKKFYEQQ